MTAPSLTIDLSSLLRPGVYLLKHGTRVTYIGKARCILAALTNHVIRNRTRLPARLDALIPCIPFDGLEIIPCDPVRAGLLQSALIDLHRPVHNKSRTASASPAPDSQSGLPCAQPAAPTQVRRL